MALPHLARLRCLLAAALLCPLASPARAATLEAEYRFDECAYSRSAGEIVDASGKGRHGTAQNSLTTGASGKIQRMGDFSSYDRWASVSVPLGSTWTISTWIKTPISTHSGSPYHILASASGGSDFMYLDSTSGRFTWGVYTSADRRSTDGLFRFGTLSAGWHHVVVVGSGSNTLLYVDGAYQDTIARKATGTVTYLGTSYDDVNTAAAQGFNAPIDEMRLYTGALTVGEIATLYANQAAGRNADGSTRSAVTCPSASTPGGFNAFETSTAAGLLSGVVKTKVAGSAFSIDIAALNTLKTALLTTFSGAVKVELLNAADNSGALDANNCRSSWSTIQTLATSPTFLLTELGRKTVSVTENNAWREVRLRISYPATGTATSVGCSTDAFAIRPSAFSTPVATDGDALIAGNSRSLGNSGASGGVVHKAGRPFSLSSSAVNALGTVTTGYSLTPVATLSACAAAGCPASLGSLTPNLANSSGALSSSTAKYSGVGAFTLQLEDSSFAAVDAADSSAAERTISSAAVVVGRFVPDRFSLSGNTPQLTTFGNSGCASRSFTYLGQPFGWKTAPSVTVTALDADGNITTGYAGSLWKLSAGTPAAACSGATCTASSGSYGATYSHSASSGGAPGWDTAQFAPGAVTLASSGNGVGTLAVGSDVLALARDTSTPRAPFTAALSLALSLTDSSESAVTGNGSISSNTLTFNGTGSGIAFDAGAEFRYGRLALQSATGTGGRPLLLPVEAQYWNTAGFTLNTADHCTTLSASQFSLGNYRGSLAACQSGLSTSGRLASGRGTVQLTAPGSSRTGAVEVSPNLGNTASGQTCLAPLPATQSAATAAAQPWLQGRWTTTSYTQNPTARAVFGIVSSRSPVIYGREMF